MKKILFLFILCFASTSYSQNEEEQDDSLLSSLNQQFELTKSDNANFTIKFKLPFNSAFNNVLINKVKIIFILLFSNNCGETVKS